MAVALAVVLTGVAGYVDAVGYLLLSHVFTANMSGNTIAIGMALVHGSWLDLVRRGSVIPLFVLGLLISRLAIDSARRHRVRSVEALLFVVEAALLGSLWIAAPRILATRPRPGTAPFLLLVAFAGVAMGIQNATLSRFGPLSVRTTHVTGTLAEMADKFAAGDLRDGFFLALVWFAYASFAAVGVMAEGRWGAAAVSIPIAIVLAVSIVILFTTSAR